MTESNSPTALDWDTLHGFYTNIAEQLHKAGIKSLTTGGIACVRYGITQSTKDCDIIIPIASAAEVIEILARAEIHHQRCHLTLKYGAPLHRRWLEGGWISHTYFGQPEQPLARLDLFGKPPRMRSTTADENPYYLSRDGFARMKKTRREKDWAYANLLGLQMLEQREIAGILHITDAKKLREICQSNDIEWSLSNQRPLLKLAIEKDPRLERYIKAEKEFWTKLDDLRLTVYEKAWARYDQELQKEATKLLPMDLQAPNEALVELGERYLDPSPLHTVGWDDLLGQAKEHTRAMFENIDQELLPTPPAFPEDTNEISR